MAMNNFNQGGPGGLRGRREFMGGRPKSDAQYGQKKSFDKKPFGANKGGFKGGDRGGSRGNFGGDRREVTMHKATCSTCSKPCEVPFRPDGSKPVLCSECFGKNRSDDRNGVERRDRFDRNDRPQRNDAPRPERGPSPDMKALQQHVAVLETKLNEILFILKGTSSKPAKKTKEVTIPADEVVTVVSDIKKPAKKAPVKKVAAKKAAPKKVAKKVAKKK